MAQTKKTRDAIKRLNVSKENIPTIVDSVNRYTYNALILLELAAAIQEKQFLPFEVILEELLNLRIQGEPRDSNETYDAIVKVHEDKLQELEKVNDFIMKIKSIKDNQ